MKRTLCKEKGIPEAAEEREAKPLCYLLSSHPWKFLKNV